MSKRATTHDSIWLYHSYQEFSCQAAGRNPADITPIHRKSRNPFIIGAKGPPVIVAVAGTLSQDRTYPRLEGRHRQVLPRIPGRIRGRLLAGMSIDGDLKEEPLEAWFVPWHIGAEKLMVISVDRETTLILDWSRFDEDEFKNQEMKKRAKLRRSAKVLERIPGIIATAPSINSAYEKLENLWNNESLEKGDPQGELLVRQAEKLRHILEELGVRPRVALRTEHRLLKLQSVRRTDSKTIKWLATKPGRNTAERAGSRQRIKAPKRYDTRNTLENRVLRAFAALTVREADSWLKKSKNSNMAEKIRAHMLRAQRVERILRDCCVPAANPPVQPNFQLRFDVRYREIWDAWLQLRRRAFQEELSWMWQHRTFMELLGLRAAMMLQKAVKEKNGRILAHAPMLKAVPAPEQGRYLEEGCISATFGFEQDTQLKIIDFWSNSCNCSKGQFSACSSRAKPCPSKHRDTSLGSVAITNMETPIWWNAQSVQTMISGTVGELPWEDEDVWDKSLEKWSRIVTARA